MIRSVAIVVVLFFLHLSFGDELYEGDACQVSRSGAPGTCKTLNNCPEAVKEFDQGGKPAHCGWSGVIEIICCKNPPRPKPTIVKVDRVSTRKCKEYERYAYETTYVTVGFNSYKNEILHCSSSQVPLVVNGEDAHEKEFPHMALIGYRSAFNEITYGCGGSLISDRFILTAAHCIVTGRLVGPPRIIRLGELDRKRTNNPVVQNIDVEEAIPHPDYNKLEKYNDIGLIRMARSVEFNQHIRPACLAETYETGTMKAIATGWGKTDYGGRPDGSDILQKVTLELYPDNECREQFIAESHSSQLRNGIVARTQFCAGSRTERKDVCQGDSGGPLQVNHPYNTCIYSIAGITSFGKRCSESTNNGTSGIYTRVFAYLAWIEPIVWPQ